MKLAKLTARHLDQILDYRHAMMVECGAEHILADDWRDVTRKIYRRLYRGKQGVHFGALERGRVVAVAGCLIKDEFPAPTLKDRRLGWIMDVYISPDFRRRGLARRLTQQCIDWLRAQGITWIKLSASSQARDYGLYDKLGFTRTAEMMIRFKTGEQDAHAHLKPKRDACPACS